MWWILRSRGYFSASWFSLVLTICSHRWHLHRSPNKGQKHSWCQMQNDPMCYSMSRSTYSIFNPVLDCDPYFIFLYVSGQNCQKEETLCSQSTRLSWCSPVDLYFWCCLTGFPAFAFDNLNICHHHIWSHERETYPPFYIANIIPTENVQELANVTHRLLKWHA